MCVNVAIGVRSAVEMCNIHVMIAITKSCLYHDTTAIDQDVSMYTTSWYEIIAV